MSMLASAARGLKNMWQSGDEDDYEDDLLEEADERQTTSSSTPKYSANKYSSDKYATNYGGGDGSSTRSRNLRSVPIPLRAREKNIYTLRPKNQDEAAIAADYLKSGSAVVMNLETVEGMVAVRIIDFMSGVCYGLEGQGHAMKLGDAIFLFTPTEYEIASDELDYGENRDFFFKNVGGASAPSPRPAVPPAVTAGMSAPVQPVRAQATSPVASTTPSGYATANYNAPAAARMSTSAPGAIASTPAVASTAGAPVAMASVPAPVNAAPREAATTRASTLPSSSVYGSSGKAHVLIGGKPATVSAPSPSPQGSRNTSGEYRSWDR